MGIIEKQRISELDEIVFTRKPYWEKFVSIWRSKLLNSRNKNVLQNILFQQEIKAVSEAATRTVL